MSTILCCLFSPHRDPALLQYSIIWAVGPHTLYLLQWECGQSDKRPDANLPVPPSPDLYNLQRLPNPEARGAFPSLPPRESLCLSVNQV